jgi:hypothetical protein
MSVEKFKPNYLKGKLKHETKPYAQILSKVLAECNDIEVIGLWCHFQGKPEDWEISVKYVQNHFNIGRQKAYKVFRNLIKYNLMEQIQEKNADGTFGQNYYIIKNGECFLKSNIHLKKHVQGTKAHVPTHVLKVAQAHRAQSLSPTATHTSPCDENPHTENPHTENRTTTYNRKIHIKEKAQRKSYCAPDGARDINFEIFYQNYPRKKNKKRAKEIWVRLNLDDKIDLLLTDIKNRLANDAQWQDAQFIPHATSYLNGERWLDDITPSKPTAHTVKMQPRENLTPYMPWKTPSDRTGEVKSTVKDFPPISEASRDAMEKYYQELRQGKSHANGSKISRNNNGRGNLRKAAEFILPTS